MHLSKKQQTLIEECSQPLSKFENCSWQTIVIYVRELNNFYM